MDPDTIVDLIIADLYSRPGLGDAWDVIEQPTLVEIRQAWKTIIVTNMVL